MLLFLLSITPEWEHDKITYLFDTYNNEMLRYAKGLLRHRHDPDQDAQDVVGEAWVKICQYIDSVNFDVPRPQLRAYVMRVVANEALDCMKIKEPTMIEEWDADAVASRDFWERIRIQERYDEVVLELKKMDDRYSIPIELRHLDNWDIKRIADFLDIPQKTVYTNISRGLTYLYNKFSEKENY